VRFLYGEFEVTLDEKSRLLVPAEIRKRLQPEDGNAFILVIGQNRVPWLYAEGYYEELIEQDRTQLRPAADELAFLQVNFAGAARLELDRQGRVLIPDRVMRRVRLNKELMLAGVRDHLELWDRAAWDNRMRDLTERIPDLAVGSKETRRPDSGHPAGSEAGAPGGQG
jgi:MraZ protein